MPTYLTAGKTNVSANNGGNIINATATQSATAYTLDESLKTLYNASKESTNQLLNSINPDNKPQLENYKLTVNRILCIDENTKHPVDINNSELLLTEPQQTGLAKYLTALPITNNTITIDQVVASLNAFKKSFYNVNYLTSLINNYSQEIIDAGQYASVLQPILKKKYYNNDDDYWVYGINLVEPLNSRIYIEDYKHSYWVGLTYQEIFDSKISQMYDNILEQDRINQMNILKQLIEKYPDNNILYLLDVYNWDYGLKILICQFQKDILDSTKWIKTCSSIYLSEFLPNTSDLSSFSPEYLKFINAISNEISILNGSDWTTDAIWPYTDPATFDTLTCLYSSVYPEWTGKLISECFIPGSTIDMTANIYSIMVDLFFNYPSLTPGQIALTTYNVGDQHYVSLVKIDTYTNDFGEKQLCFKQKRIEINSYFPSLLSYQGDTVIKGSLNVQTYDGKNIIKTDNVSKITTFHNKIGVNQDNCKVKGLVDIDNLSNNSILNMMDDFVNPLLYSYEVTMDIKDQIKYGDANVIIPLTYQEDVFVFKAPITNVIYPKDITLLYLPVGSDIFSNYIFLPESFNKIQTIVNELNKMQPEIDLNEETRSFLFSFVELLSDTKYYYLCSLRGVVKINPNDSTQRELYFICGFLNVNDTIINNNYKPYMIKLTDKFSSCCRLTNYSNLLVLDPSVQANLFQGHSISMSTDPKSPYFSDRINNNPYFRDRFGGKDLYVACYEYLTNEQLLIADSNYELFHELFPYFNNKQSNTLFLPNTDISAFSVSKIQYEQFNNLYGSDKEIMSFFTNYDWIKGIKITFENIITIKGKKYFIACGINLSDVIDESIILKGDNKITGNLAVLDDTTNVPVFNVNREKKQTSSVYHTGIGTTNPQTMLDVNDCGVTDIINLINAMAKEYNLINYNLQGIMSALTQSESSAVQYIETKFIDPATGKQIVQNINGYLCLRTIPDTLYELDTKVIYNWLYSNWNNKTLRQLLDNNKNDNQAINFAINAEIKMFNNYNIFDSCDITNVYNWVAGIKINVGKTVNVNNQLYRLHLGVNIQQYVTYESNTNIQKFFACLQSYNYQLQDIVIRYNNIPSSEILNQQKASDVRYQYAQQYPIQNLFQYTIDLTNISEMTIEDLNYNTLQTSNTQVYKKINDTNLTTKLMFLFINLKQNYNSINKNDYGIIYFEDQYEDFVSLFWCSDVTNNILTLISLELKINTIIIPSLKINGDVKVVGDVYFTSCKDINNKNTYLHIDSDKKFLGINTLQSLSNYADTYETTTNGMFAKNNVYITSDTYPNTIVERISETDEPSDSNYHRFKNFSTLSSRRNSNLYTFEELYNYSKKYKTTNEPNLINCYGTKENHYYYGPDNTYEVQDVTNITKEIGNTHIVIENIEKNPEDNSIILRGGFGVSMVDPLSNGTSQEREIFHVNNDSQMYVNSIMLGGHLLEVDASGNLLFDKKKVTLSE